MFTLYKKEIKSYFTGMTGVIFISLVLIVTGIFSSVVNFKSLSPKFELALSGAMLIFLLAMPVLTMKSFAEERRGQTERLLFSLPISETKIVTAKFLSMVTVFACSVLVMCLYPLIFSIYAEVNFAASYGAIFAFFMLGCALISIGMFISTFTESQVIASVLTFGVFLLLYLLPLISLLIPTAPIASVACVIVAFVLFGVVVWLVTGNVTASLVASGVGIAATLAAYLIDSSWFESLAPNLLKKLSLFDRLYTFTDYGIFDLTGLVYFATVALLFTYLTVRSLNRRRWS